MANLNVFEMTNSELCKSLKESKKGVKSRRGLKESKLSAGPRRKTRRIAESFRRKYYRTGIPVSSIKLESCHFFEENDIDDTMTDYTPEDDVVLVIDPDLEEAPTTEEDAMEAAEELVGDYVCKCSICGANYVCDHECIEENEITEELESTEEVCPVCGEEGEQIVIGEITSTEDSTDFDNDIDDDMDDDTMDDLDDVEDDFDDVEDDFNDDLNDEMDNTMDDFDDDTEDDFEDDDIQENYRRPRHGRRVREHRSTTPQRAIKFDESTLNRMLTKFARENYNNAKFVKITSGKIINKQLSLEGIVTTKKGSRQKIRFVSESFKPVSGKISLRFRCMGPFTESMVNKNKPSFILDCVSHKNILTPVTLKYNYVVRENLSRYKVSGKVVAKHV